MDSDNLYPNDGTFVAGVPVEPLEQRVARKKEQAETLEALKVIETVVTHFKERIAFRDSLSSIKVDLTKDPALHQKVCEVNDLLKLALEEEAQLLQDLLDTHDKR